MSITWNDELRSEVNCNKTIRENIAHILDHDMKVGNLSHKHSNDGSVISATVGDETIWFDVDWNVEPKSFGKCCEGKS